MSSTFHLIKSNDHFVSEPEVIFIIIIFFNKMPTKRSKYTINNMYVKKLKIMPSLITV